MLPSHWKGNIDRTAKTYSLPPPPTFRSQSRPYRVRRLHHSPSGMPSSLGHKRLECLKFFFDETTNVYESINRQGPEILEEALERNGRCRTHVEGLNTNGGPHKYVLLRARAAEKAQATASHSLKCSSVAVSCGDR